MELTGSAALEKLSSFAATTSAEQTETMRLNAASLQICLPPILRMA